MSSPVHAHTHIRERREKNSEGIRLFSPNFQAIFLLSSVRVIFQPDSNCSSFLSRILSGNAFSTQFNSSHLPLGSNCSSFLSMILSRRAFSTQFSSSHLLASFKSLEFLVKDSQCWVQILKFLVKDSQCKSFSEFEVRFLLGSSLLQFLLWFDSLF